VGLVEGRALFDDPKCRDNFILEVKFTLILLTVCAFGIYAIAAEKGDWRDIGEAYDKAWAIVMEVVLGLCCLLGITLFIMRARSIYLRRLMKDIVVYDKRKEVGRHQQNP